jgi:hypothetical protein
MKNRALLLGIVGISLTASYAAIAGVQVSVGWNPFGYWGPSPPVVYAPPRYYAPPAVYYGRGHWGDQRDARGHHDDHGRSSEHNGGDGRH